MTGKMNSKMELIRCPICDEDFSQWIYEGHNMLKVHQLTVHLFDKIPSPEQNKSLVANTVPQSAKDTPLKIRSNPYQAIETTRSDFDAETSPLMNHNTHSVASDVSPDAETHVIRSPKTKTPETPKSPLKKGSKEKSSHKKIQSPPKKVQSPRKKASRHISTPTSHRGSYANRKSNIIKLETEPRNIKRDRQGRRERDERGSKDRRERSLSRKSPTPPSSLRAALERCRSKTGGKTTPNRSTKGTPTSEDTSKAQLESVINDVLSWIPNHNREPQLLSACVGAYARKNNDMIFFVRYGARTGLQFVEKYLSDLVEIFPAPSSNFVLCRKKKIGK